MGSHAKADRVDRGFKGCLPGSWESQGAGGRAGPKGSRQNLQCWGWEPGWLPAEATRVSSCFLSSLSSR